MMQLLIATRNLHKVEEIRSILAERFSCSSLNEFSSAPKVIENANSFAGNAAKKAIELARWFGSTVRNGSANTPTFVLADDSGLEVDALGGAPGVHSARFAASDLFAGENSSDTENNKKLLTLLKDVPVEKRAARFRCVVALTPVLLQSAESSSPVCYVDEHEIQTRCFEGTCEGRIGFAPRGHGGFGYDPLFIPDGYWQTFAELGESVKNQLSHRATALEKLSKALSLTEAKTGWVIGT